MLCIMCDICSHPRLVPDYLEPYIPKLQFLECPECKQKSTVSTELKQHVKEYRGIR